MGSSETGLAAGVGEKVSTATSGVRTRLWQDGVLAQLVRAAMRLELDEKRFRDEFYNPKTYANLLGASSGSGAAPASPPELQLWLHLDGVAAHSASFRHMLTGRSLQLANGEVLPTGPSSCRCFSALILNVYHQP